MQKCFIKFLYDNNGKRFIHLYSYILRFLNTKVALIPQQHVVHGDIVILIFLFVMTDDTCGFLH